MTMEPIQASDCEILVPSGFVFTLCKLERELLCQFSGKDILDYLAYALCTTDEKPPHKVEAVILDMHAFRRFESDTYVPLHVVGVRVGLLYLDGDYLRESDLTTEEAVRLTRYCYGEGDSACLLQDVCNSVLREGGIGRVSLEDAVVLLDRCRDVFTVDEWVEQLAPLGPDYVKALVKAFEQASLLDCSPDTRDVLLPHFADARIPLPGPRTRTRESETIYFFMNANASAEPWFPEVPWKAPCWVFRKRSLQEKEWDLLIVPPEPEDSLAFESSRACDKVDMFGFKDKLVQYCQYDDRFALGYGYHAAFRVIDLATGRTSLYKGHMWPEGSDVFLDHVFGVGDRLFARCSQEYENDGADRPIHRYLYRDILYEFALVKTQTGRLVVPVGHKVLYDGPPGVVGELSTVPVTDGRGRTRACVGVSCGPPPKNAIYVRKKRLRYDPEHRCWAHAFEFAEYNADDLEAEPVWHYATPTLRNEDSWSMEAFMIGNRHVCYTSLERSHLNGVDFEVTTYDFNDVTSTHCKALMVSPRGAIGRRLAVFTNETHLTMTVLDKAAGRLSTLPMPTLSPTHEASHEASPFRVYAASSVLRAHHLTPDRRTFEVDPWKDLARRGNYVYRGLSQKCEDYLLPEVARRVREVPKSWDT